MTAELDFSGPIVVDDNPSLDEDEIRDEIPEGPSCKTCGKVIVREPGKRGRMPSYHPECRPSTKKASGTRRKTKKSVGAPDYSEGLQAIFQMVAFGLSIAGERNEMVLADGMAVAEHGPNICLSLNQLAQEKPEVAAVLDRVLAIGPYGLVLGAVAPLFMQIASNHGVKVPGMQNAHDYVQRFTPAGVTSE